MTPRPDPTLRLLFHGLLIQVTEAPIPISALLPADVVNRGGFELLRFAPLVAEVPAAQALLLAAGTVRAVSVVWVMTTRVSIKVVLACWNGSPRGQRRSDRAST